MYKSLFCSLFKLTVEQLIALRNIGCNSGLVVLSEWSVDGVFL